MGASGGSFRSRGILPACLLALGFAGTALGQELEPRAYSPAPVGTHFLVLVAEYSYGNVLLDPSLPITDLSARIGKAAFGYAQTFNLAGRTASVAVTLPAATGHFNGTVYDEYQQVTRSGFADLRARLALNLLGGPALSPPDFARRKPAPALGASLLVSAPTGHYDPDLLINVGMNRWAFKPEVGLSLPSGKWIVDLTVGVWLFTDNTDFYGGQTRSQEPLWAPQAHVSYTFRPGLWLAFDATYYTGGQTKVGGVVKDDRQGNGRGGLTFSVPVSGGWSLKLSASTGVVVRIGGRFTSLAAALQYRWFGR